MYYAEVLTHRRYQMPRFFPTAKCENRVISFLGIISTWPLAVLATDHIFDYCLLKQGNGATQSVSYWIYNDKGHRWENITDWALDQFHKYYKSGLGKKGRPITKRSIFYYVYGVLQDPIYREKYAINLKREFPRIPFYKNFWQWADWGKELMELHIGYESVKPGKLKRTDVPDAKGRKAGLMPKVMLKTKKGTDCIVLDSETTLSGIPTEAWEYRLGNRSALEWVLEQYKEKKQKDPTVRGKFNTYRFADYKEKVIDLLSRVTTVSVQTVSIVNSMKRVAR